MKKNRTDRRRARMLPEYDFSAGVRGKYAGRFLQGTNLVLLAPDVAKVYLTSKSVNDALRKLIRPKAPKSPKGGSVKR